MNDNTLGWRTQLTLGAIFTAMACRAVRIDYINNVVFGGSISPEAADVLGMAAILVALIPAGASILGWCWLSRAGLAVVLVLTVYSANEAYSTKQGETVLAAETAQANYKKAKAKETRAKAVLSSIKEVGTAIELGNLAAKADATLAEAETAFKRDCKRPRSEACQEATAAKNLADGEAKLAHQRLSQAEARDKAEADLAEAEARSAKGPAQKREESPLMTWLFIAATQITALLGEKGVRLIAAGWQAMPRKAAKAKRAAAPVNPTGGTREPLPANVVPLRKHSVEAWIASATVLGGELKGGEALKSYKGFAKDAAMTAGELRSILAHIHGDALEKRTSGYVVRGISLRTVIASEKRAASC